jgi:hypothetical protein
MKNILKFYLMLWAALPAVAVLIACAIVLSRASDLFMFICYAISCAAFLTATCVVYALGYVAYKAVVRLG